MTQKQKKTHFDIEVLKRSACASKNEHLFIDYKRKGSKYGNIKVEFDGYKFDSKKECTRYIQLRMLLRIGEISDLKLQQSFELNEGGTYSLKYIADFTYYETKNNTFVVEDVKGYETITFKKKEKLMLQIYNIVIKKT
jgi:Protein of unknown function (DUF1064)